MESVVERAARMLKGARRLVALTGSGMSRESGIPTFREAQTGLGARYDPVDLATSEAFQRNPDRVFGWYLWRWRVVQEAQPHAGHYALVQLGRLVESFLVVTQNVDGLHRRAGSPDVVELHGSLAPFRCVGEGHPYPSELLEDLAPGPNGEVPPPACTQCSSPVTPGVVWFGGLSQGKR